MRKKKSYKKYFLLPVLVLLPALAGLFIRAEAQETVSGDTVHAERAAAEQEPVLTLPLDHTWGQEKKSILLKNGHFGEGRLLMRENFRVLSLNGNPYEMGYQHGSLFKDELKSFIADVKSYLQSQGKTPLPRRITGLLPGLDKSIPAAYLDELKGMAEGSGIRLADLLMLNAFMEGAQVRSGSGFALGPEVTLGRKHWLGYNLDLGEERLGFLEKYRAVIFFHPENSPVFVSVGYIGGIGVWSGMNDKGLSVAVDSLSGSDKPGAKKGAAGLLGLAVRDCLARAGKISEVVEPLKDRGVSGSVAVLIGSREEKRSAVLEIFGNTGEVREWSSAGVFSAGCLLSQELSGQDPCGGRLTGLTAAQMESDPGIMKGPECRYARYAKLIEDRAGRIGLPELLEIVRDPYPAERFGYVYPGPVGIAGRGSVLSVIYNLTDNLFYVGLGQRPAALDGFAGLDFKSGNFLERDDWPVIVPETGYFSLRRGMELLAKGQYDAAQENLDAALALDGENLVARYYLVRCALGRKDPERAAALTLELSQAALDPGWEGWLAHALEPELPADRPTVLANPLQR